jgi:hypothetical protein
VRCGRRGGDWRTDWLRSSFCGNADHACRESLVSEATGDTRYPELPEAAVVDDPDPDAFEGWFRARCLGHGRDVSVGAVRAMAMDPLAEWRLAGASPRSAPRSPAGRHRTIASAPATGRPRPASLASLTTDRRPAPDPALAA